MNIYTISNEDEEHYIIADTLEESVQLFLDHINKSIPTFTLDQIYTDFFIIICIFNGERINYDIHDTGEVQKGVIV